MAVGFLMIVVAGLLGTGTIFQIILSDPHLNSKPWDTFHRKIPNVMNLSAFGVLALVFGLVAVTDDDENGRPARLLRAMGCFTLFVMYTYQFVLSFTPAPMPRNSMRKLQKEEFDDGSKPAGLATDAPLYIEDYHYTLQEDTPKRTQGLYIGAALMLVASSMGDIINGDGAASISRWPIVAVACYLAGDAIASTIGFDTVYIEPVIDSAQDKATYYFARTKTDTKTGAIVYDLTSDGKFQWPLGTPTQPAQPESRPTTNGEIPKVQARSGLVPPLIGIALLASVFYDL